MDQAIERQRLEGKRYWCDAACSVDNQMFCGRALHALWRNRISFFCMEVGW